MTFALTNATLLDGTENMTAQEGMCVLVDDGKISKIGKMADASLPDGCEVVDLQGKYLMPGLINMHVHLCGDGKPHSSDGAEKLVKLALSLAVGRAYLRATLKKSLQTQLASGVTTVRSVGDPGYADIAVRDIISSGKCEGPRLIASGCGISVPGGHARLFAKMATSEVEARAFVREHAEKGADQIKLFITGGVFDAEVEGEPGVLRMSQEIATAICDEASKLGLLTSAHVESPEGVEVALKAGVDTIEHGSVLSSELVELFKENGLHNSSSLTCTISPALPFACFDPEITHSTHIQKVNGRIVYEGVVEAARTALKTDIPVGLGTDSACPFVTHYDMWREVVYFQKHTGVSNAFALYTATLKNAELLRVADETGSVEVGKSADLIVTEKNPLEDLMALGNVEKVFMKGNLVKTCKVNHLPELDKELDTIWDDIEKDPFVSEWK